MNKSDFAKIIGEIRSTAAKHSPSILTGLGIASMITTTFLAVKATPKALRLIDERKNHENIDELAPVDVVKTTWKCYIPAVATGTFGVACLIGANSVNAKRNAALATAYKIAETSLSEYREKVIETIGEKKEKTVREAVAKERVDKNPVKPSEVIVVENGNTLCFDPLSGRYFKSDINKIRKAENAVNKRMWSEMSISLNEFYDELGLDHVDFGGMMGWNVDNPMDLSFSSILDKDNNPCLAIDYLIPPKYEFDKLY